VRSLSRQAVHGDRSQAPSPSRTVTVLYIAGLGRSGSTLLERIVGRVPGYFPVGEVVFLWRRGVRDNEPCGCGVPFRTCPFWTRVGDEAFGGWDALDADEVLALRHRVDRHRYLAAMLAPRLWPGYHRQLRRYADLLERLYQAIGTVSGAQVVVDSSKEPSYAYLLRHVRGVRLRVVHLVRRSHGVAFSQSKRVKRPEGLAGDQYMVVRSPTGTAIEWLLDNSLLDLLPLFGVPSLRLRYESLVAAPRQHVVAVLDHAGRPAAGPALDRLDDGHVDLAPDHTVSGNPLRFRTGRLQLRVDEEWRRAMPRRQRLAVAVITWPLLLRYGYRGRG
jgi:Sulfotransferase family